MCILTCGIVAANEQQSEMITVYSVKEMEPYFKNSNAETLIIFDVDSTLTTPTDPCLQRQTIKRYKDFYNSQYNSLTENEKRIFLHLGDNPKASECCVT